MVITTINKINQLLEEELERLDTRVLELVHTYGRDISGDILNACKEAYDNLGDFEDWKESQED